MECYNFLHTFQLLNGGVRLAVEFAQILIARLGVRKVGEIEYLHDRSQNRTLIPWSKAEGHRFHERSHDLFDDIGMLLKVGRGGDEYGLRTINIIRVRVQ